MTTQLRTIILSTILLALTACNLGQGGNPNGNPNPNRTDYAQSTKKPVKLDSFTFVPQPTGQATIPPTSIPQNTLPPQFTPIPPQNTPSPPPQCTVDLGQPMVQGCKCDGYIVECENRVCKSVVNGDVLPAGYVPKSGCFDHSGMIVDYNGRATASTPNFWCSLNHVTPGGNGTWCLLKPVVYLYPTTPTLVDVWVETVGDVVVSDPHYPFGGWQDVLAHPDGTLEYQGKTYVELFYESEVTTVITPKSGISIATSHLKPTLTLLTTQLGLSPTEQAEFLDFWVPRLTGLGQPYIMFSVIETFEKLRIDQVHLSPEPDTRIEFLAYFKPLAAPYTGPVLQLPPRPERVGFTMVEWGGTIDQSQANPPQDILRDVGITIF